MQLFAFRGRGDSAVLRELLIDLILYYRVVLKYLLGPAVSLEFDKYFECHGHFVSTNFRSFVNPIHNQTYKKIVRKISLEAAESPDPELHATTQQQTCRRGRVRLSGE